MLVSKNAKICITPNANPQRESVEYRMVGCPTQNNHIGHVDFMLFIPFCSRWVPNVNAVLSGIWALWYSDLIPAVACHEF